MNKRFMHLALALMLATPLSAIAGMGADENINIYGWQNWSYEFVDADKGNDVDRLSNNAANIGFMSHMDTGIPAYKWVCVVSSSPTGAGITFTRIGVTVIPRSACATRRWVKSCSASGCYRTTKSLHSG